MLIPQVLVIAVMLLMHITRVLGVRAMIVYFVTMMALELVSEYVDIATDGGWYGAHFAYTSLWGPQLFGVPIVPPVSIAVLVWPAFCAARSSCAATTPSTTVAGVGSQPSRWR